VAQLLAFEFALALGSMGKMPDHLDPLLGPHDLVAFGTEISLRFIGVRSANPAPSGVMPYKHGLRESGKYFFQNGRSLLHRDLNGTILFGDGVLFLGGRPFSRRTDVSRFLTIADAGELYTGRRTGDRFIARICGRIIRAITLSEFGRVQRISRGWLLNQSNLERLRFYMKRRWNMEPLAAQQSLPEAG
jgi:hypothetical protein